MGALGILAVLLCATCHVALSFTDGLMKNGNFELAPKPEDMNGTVVLGKTAIPEWEISGFVEYIKAGQKQGDMLLVVPEGAFAVRLGNEASIKQRVKTTIGMYYSITFSAARTCAQEERINVSVAPDFGILPIQTLYSSNGWDSYSWAFQADYDLVEIILHNPGVEEDPACGPLVDSIFIKALYPPKATNKNILKNGDLEEGPWVPNVAPYTGVLIPPNIEDDHSPLPGWMVESLKAVKYIDSDHFSVPQGKRAVELVAGKESAIVQVVRTIPGKTYDLFFAVGDASNSAKALWLLRPSGKDTLKVPYESKGKGGYKRAVLRFVATTPRTRIMFYSTFYTMRSDDYSSLCGPVLDDVKLLSVRGKPRKM